ncbi:hypothetical protein [Fibrella aquatilis]|uniref:Uncharacterized protein n=1 Tax=Fibrella aquatilis TaxID=2817059 RepID=A0A939K1X0_9BACT|nr:hypothetical protein [Fibrella aquatilis]MBO0933953.1 hypothetical protein [Fibrella aquatilis]
MRLATTLSIPTPCPESWANMNPTPGGRHCTSCQQVVQDFTQFTDAELVAWFAQHNGPACGRLRDDQLNVVLYDSQPTASLAGRWVRWAVALVMGWQTAQAQTASPNPASSRVALPATVPLTPRQTVLIGKAEEPVLFFVRGQVRYANDEPAQVRVWKNQDVQLYTDQVGNFEVPIFASDQQADSLKIRISGGDAIITVSTKQVGPPILVKLDHSPYTIMGGGIVAKRAPLPRRAWWSLKRLFAKK